STDERADERAEDPVKARKKPGAPKPGGEPGNGWPRRNVLLLLAMVAASLLLVQVLDSGNRADEIPYSQFRKLVSDPAWPVTEVTITRVSEGYELTGLRGLTAEEEGIRRGLDG